MLELFTLLPLYYESRMKLQYLLVVYKSIGRCLSLKTVINRRIKV